MAMSMNVGKWTSLIIGSVVLLIIVAALFTPLNSALNSYAANETTFGPIIKTIVPLLIGVGILLLFVGAFLAYRER